MTEQTEQPDPQPDPPETEEIPDIVRYVLDDGDECPAVVTRWHPNGQADLRVVLSFDQSLKYSGGEWWNREYLAAVGGVPPECFCDQGHEPGQFYVPEAAIAGEGRLVLVEDLTSVAQAAARDLIWDKGYRTAFLVTPKENELAAIILEHFAPLKQPPPRPEPAGGATDELRKWLELLWFEGFYEGKSGKGIERRDADVAEAVKGIESIPAAPAAVAAEGAGEAAIARLIRVRYALGFGPAVSEGEVVDYIVAMAARLAAAESARAAAEKERDRLQRLVDLALKVIEGPEARAALAGTGGNAGE
jgi:hypothetical protein